MLTCDAIKTATLFQLRGENYVMQEVMAFKDELEKSVLVRVDESLSTVYTMKEHYVENIGFLTFLDALHVLNTQDDEEPVFISQAKDVFYEMHADADA